MEQLVGRCLLSSQTPQTLVPPDEDAGMKMTFRTHQFQSSSSYVIDRQPSSMKLRRAAGDGLTELVISETGSVLTTWINPETSLEVFGSAGCGSMRVIGSYLQLKSGAAKP